MSRFLLIPTFLLLSMQHAVSATVSGTLQDYEVGKSRAVQLSTTEQIEDEISDFKVYFRKRFDFSPNDFAKGIYTLDPGLKQRSVEQKDASPLVQLISRGEDLWNAPLLDGSNFEACFGVSADKVRPLFPRFDNEAKQVETLVLAINACREQAGDFLWPVNGGNMLLLSAYLAEAAKGSVIDIPLPGTVYELEAFNEGRTFFYTKRGSSNLSCASCHLEAAGDYFKEVLLTPALGQISHFPIWSSGVGKRVPAGLMSLHERFVQSNILVGAKPLRPQSEAYRNLEYFMTVMNRDLPYVGVQFQGK